MLAACAKASDKPSGLPLFTPATSGSLEKHESGRSIEKKTKSYVKVTLLGKSNDDAGVDVRCHDKGQCLAKAEVCRC